LKLISVWNVIAIETAELTKFFVHQVVTKLESTLPLFSFIMIF